MRNYLSGKEEGTCLSSISITLTPTQWVQDNSLDSRSFPKLFCLQQELQKEAIEFFRHLIFENKKYIPQNVIKIITM